MFYFTACAWGSTRPTKKAFLSTLSDMARLVADCPGNHVHEPYGRKRNEQGQLIYATAEEAAYPRALCLQIRKIVQESLNLFPEHAQAHPATVTSNAAGSTALSLQPRGRRMPPLIKEFVASQTIETTDKTPLGYKIMFDASVAPHSNSCQTVVGGKFKWGRGHRQAALQVWCLQKPQASGLTRPYR